MEKLIAELHSIGIVVLLRGDKLSVSPRKKITPEIDVSLKSNRAELVAWLALPWPRQHEADAVLLQIDVILKNIPIHARAPERCLTAMGNVCQDCRELANERVAARDFEGLLDMKRHALYLAERIPPYCRAEAERATDGSSLSDAKPETPEGAELFFSDKAGPTLFAEPGRAVDLRRGAEVVARGAGIKYVLWYRPGAGRKGTWQKIYGPDTSLQCTRAIGIDGLSGSWLTLKEGDAPE